MSFTSIVGLAGAVVSPLLVLKPLLLALLPLLVLAPLLLVLLPLLGLSPLLVFLLEELPLPSSFAIATIPPIAATPAATHNQLGLNAQNGVATLLPPNACGANTCSASKVTASLSTPLCGT